MKISARTKILVHSGAVLTVALINWTIGTYMEASTVLMSAVFVMALPAAPWLANDILKDLAAFDAGPKSPTHVPTPTPPEELSGLDKLLKRMSVDTAFSELTSLLTSGRQMAAAHGQDLDIDPALVALVTDSFAAFDGAQGVKNHVPGHVAALEEHLSASLKTLRAQAVQHMERLGAAAIGDLRRRHDVLLQIPA